MNQLSLPALPFSKGSIQGHKVEAALAAHPGQPVKLLLQKPRRAKGSSTTHVRGSRMHLDSNTPGTTNALHHSQFHLPFCAGKLIAPQKLLSLPQPYIQYFLRHLQLFISLNSWGPSSASLLERTSSQTFPFYSSHPCNCNYDDFCKLPAPIPRARLQHRLSGAAWPLLGSWEYTCNLKPAILLPFNQPVTEGCTKAAVQTFCMGERNRKHLQNIIIIKL